MSILETPRILFRGNMAWDPIVTNNLSNFYDETDGESLLPGTPHVPPNAAAARTRVLGFRQEAIGSVVQGVWDPQGSHRSSFYDLAEPDPSCADSALIFSQVSAADLGNGLDTGDTFVGAPARFSGMLVDLEPYGGISSQLFFDSMVFGIDGGCRIVARRLTRATARYISFNRNPVGAVAGIASVVWQTSFRTEDLIIDAFDSQALQALETALGGAGVAGLTVRWNAYRTIYYGDADLANTDPRLHGPMAADLAAKLTLKDPYGNGVWQPNPARSKMVGVIGLWREGEPLHEPGDRALLATQFPNPPAGAPGTAFARLDGASLTLDLGNCIPETGLDLQKAPMGDLTLYAQLPTQPPSTIAIGTLTQSDYDRTAYEAGSGIVTLTVDPQAFPPDCPLQLCQGDTVILQEAPLRAIPITPNLYVDGDAPATAAFQLYQYGVPGGGGTDVSIVVIDPQGNIIGQPVTVTATPDGVVALDLPTTKPGILCYVPLLPGDVPPAPQAGPNTQVNTYMYVRRSPADEATASFAPTWDNVYSAVLANWNAMAPCMDNWLDLYDETQVRAYASVIKALTSPANFEAYNFMPVVRDMTAGQRTLLYAFLDSPAPGAAEALAATAADEAPEANFTIRSRALRGN